MGDVASGERVVLVEALQKHRLKLFLELFVLVRPVAVGALVALGIGQMGKPVVHAFHEKQNIRPAAESIMMAE